MPRTVVILHPGGFGDLLLAVPAIHGLRERFPSHRFLLCGHGEACQFLAECGLLEYSLSVESSACTGLFGGRTPEDGLLVDWLSRCDYAVAWTSDESGVLSAALRRCGAAAAVVQSPFTPPLTALHQSERYAAIVGVQTGSMPQLSLPEALKAEGKKCLLHCTQAARPLALVHPGSGSRHKCVTPEIMVQVLQGLEAQGFEPLLLEGPADEEIMERLLDRLSQRPILLRGLSARQLAGVLSQVELFVGHDSGVTHLAALVGTPTVAVFGPTDPARWGPQGPVVTVIKEKFCSCPTWDAVKSCQDKPCLDVSPSAILHACLGSRATMLNPRIC